MPAPRPELLLRYRFDSLEQLKRHLNVLTGGRTLFFYPSRTVQGEGGDRVLLEVSEGEQQMLLRGTVLSRVEGGLWLDFPDGRLARWLTTRSLTGRHQRRLPADLMVDVRGNARRLGRLLDISLGGGKLVGVPGLTAGTVAELKLVTQLTDVPSDLGRAQVVRVIAGEAAIKFVRSDPATRLAVTKLFEAVRARWANAPEAVHRGDCCVRGEVLAPTMPRVIARDARLAE
jgi:hypothetical protein